MAVLRAALGVGARGDLKASRGRREAWAWWEVRCAALLQRRRQQPVQRSAMPVAVMFSLTACALHLVSLSQRQWRAGREVVSVVLPLLRCSDHTLCSCHPPHPAAHSAAHSAAHLALAIAPQEE